MNLSKIKEIGEYEVLMREDLPDIHAEGVLLKHKKSGARIAYIPCEDNNKVFSIGFRTPPSDSTGVAHIIEHTVLCGSEKYPLKDPFVELVKGSLNTFLNAMTYPDKTLYPVASTNDADFRNLMNVYLDAVFFPNIYHEQNIFRQEGWHYEMESAESPLVINGVVYNEMKGAFSSPDDVLEREIMNALFPDTSYGVESGGDPDVIPSLTYENYLDFHRRYYHPSNSYIFIYGDMDAAETLSFLDREYLCRFDEIEIDSALKVQAPFSSRRTVVRAYPISNDEEEAGNTFLSYNVVAGDCLDTKKLIAMDVLDYALLSAPGAPLRQALIDAGIGLDVYGGYQSGILQPYFMICARHADEKDADRFLKVITDTLKDQVEKGISRESLRAGLSSLEFSFREADYGLFPKGLYYGLDCMNTWLYSDDHPFSGLMQLDAFDELKKLIDEGYFEKLIEECFLDNPHSALVVLRPERGLAKKRDDELAKRLKEKRDAMSDEEREAVVRITRELREWQDSEETPEAIASLPVLKRSDLKREILQFSNHETRRDVQLCDGTAGDLRIIYHDANCNGIGYLSLLFDAKRVPSDLIPYLGLLKSVLLGIDTKSYTYMELNNAVYSHTGGITVNVSTLEGTSFSDSYKAYLTVRMKALLPEMAKGGELIEEILYTSRFEDKKRMKEILSQTRSQMEVQLQSSGNLTAATRALAYTAPESAFQDQVGGIAFYKFLRDLEEHFEEKSGEIEESLRKVISLIVRPDNLIVSYICDTDKRESLMGALKTALRTEKSGVPLGNEQDVAPYGLLNEGFMTPGQVQYVALAGGFHGSGVPYSGAMGVLRQILSFEYLWQNVRVRGGAYGCSGSMKRNGRGIFTSYRDPHLARTKKVFEDVVDYVRNFEADEDTMTKYVIGTISSMDTPLTPSTFGLVSLRAYLTGLTDEMRETFRREVIDADASSIRATADALESIVKSGNFCVLGSETEIRKHEDLFKKVETLL